jgi:CRP-like cAMP-binding protein
LVADLGPGVIATVAELAPGELFGLVHHDRGDRSPTRVVAVSDCDMVVVDGATAGLVVGRSPALADALTHLATTRRRRVDVLVGEQSGPAGNAQAQVMT